MGKREVKDRMGINKPCLYYITVLQQQQPPENGLLSHQRRFQWMRNGKSHQLDSDPLEILSPEMISVKSSYQMWS